MSHLIRVHQDNKIKEIECNKGDNLLKVLLKNNYEINAYCGGEGICGKCKIKLKGEINKPNKSELEFLDDKELKEGFRLSCLYNIKSNLDVILTQKDDITVMTKSIITEMDLNLDLKKENIYLKKADLRDQRDYLQRIYNKSDTDQIDYSNLKKIENLKKDSEISVIKKKNKIIDIRTDLDKGYYGLAVDIGTTTIVIYLLDLETGQELDTYSFYNPQKKFGADVISRINYTINNKDGLKKIKKTIVDKLNKGIDHLVENNNIKYQDIYKMSVVGNTVMLHLLLGIDALNIAKAPYVPIFTEEINLSPKETEIKINKNGLVQLLPSISGYVGADITGDMLAVNINKLNGINLLIDIGTNGEIVLSSNKKILSCSAAAGPAFEGANITFGTAGISGAISKFLIKDNKIQFKTINDKEPIGICGSGLLDMIAEFYKYNFIESSGRIVSKEKLKDWQKPFLKEYKGQKALKITNLKNYDKQIFLTQKDIREVQLAKGAIAAGIEILLKELNYKDTDINRVFIAGGFGNYINPDNACFIKMIPNCLKDKIIQIGNGAGTGAKIYLLNKNAKREAENIIKKVKYIELSINKEFQTEYIKKMSF
ncbi:MAG: ASKHA domain-containing protein [Halanaerobiales bacterium]|nr:ASKHA domain-containing protein [Halanaerobiales bacterium]